MIRILPRALALAAILFAASSDTLADDKQSTEELRNTVINVLEGLVQKGVLTREQAEAMVADAQAKAAQAAQARATHDAAEQGAVRVNNVPEIVRQQITDELRADMHDDVVKDVVKTAKQEGWGVPGALPEWAKIVKFYGDVRARYEADLYADDNIPNVYLAINSVNSAGGVSAAGVDAFLNTSVDRHRLVGRLRLGATVQLGGAFEMDFRLTSGNTRNPVSTNQTLGATYDGRWDTVVDKAAVLWSPTSQSHEQMFELRVGRFANPFVSINELIWDNDLTFEGLAATYSLDVFGRIDNVMEKGLFLTVGAFPLQEVELSNDDKWLYGAQLGVDFGVGQDVSFRVAGGYFQFQNIAGVRNPFLGSEVNNFTAPGFVQKGNSLYDIHVDDPNSELFALAGEYALLNGNIWIDFDFSGTHLLLGGEYVKNVAWNRDEVLARTNGQVYQPRLSTDMLDERTTGYEVGVVVGQPKTVAGLGQWRAALFYKHLERDAVVDSFTDSDFHLGGTDAEGYQFAFDVGLSRGAWLRLRYLTANEIDGPPLGIDVLQLDLNGQF